MSEIYNQNKFLMSMQIGRIFENDIKKITSTQFRLFSIKENTFVITITTIKKEGIWFDTSWYDDNRFKTNIAKHRIYSKDSNLLANEIFERLTKSEIEHADDICLKLCTKYKTPVITPAETSQAYLNNSTPRMKRSTSLPKITEVTTLIKPTNEFERRQAEFERKLFWDPKMWKYQES